MAAVSFDDSAFAGLGGSQRNINADRRPANRMQSVGSWGGEGVATEEEILKSYVKGGVVSTFQDAVTRDSERSVRQVMTLVEGCKQVVLSKTAVAKDAEKTAETEEKHLKELEQEQAALLKKREAILRSSGLAVVKQRKAREFDSQLDILKAQIEAQSENVYRERQILELALRERDAADLELHRMREELLRCQQTDSNLQAQDRVVSDYRAQQERLAVDRARRRHRKVQKQLSSTRTAMLTDDERKADIALRQNATARSRLATEEQKWGSLVEEGDNLVQSHHKQRTAAVLELKRNADRAMSELKGKNEAAAKKKEKEEEREAQEFEEILEDGRNPYEVFRRRKRDADVVRQRKRKEAAKAQSERNIARRMVTEAERDQLVNETKRKEREYEEVYQKEMGRANTEARVSQFISKRTRGGDDLIDPTGRTFRIEPSQVTTIKDHSFGLGSHAKHRPDIVDKIKAKPAHANVKPDPRWLPKRVARKSVEEDEVVAVADDDDVHSDAEADNRLKTRELTVLEKKLMKEARTRQRNNITQKQVVWGKEYKGRAFLSEPATLDFKDFVVGKPMRIRMVLTNVSYTFNSFKLVSLDDDIKDFFEFKYKPPGRMSAGMTCTILVIFTPKRNVDISSSLSLLASTGPISIPLTCSTKKALPVIEQPVTDVQNVVLGEAVTRNLQIVNRGALPVTVTVTAGDDGGRSAANKRLGQVLLERERRKQRQEEKGEAEDGGEGEGEGKEAKAEEEEDEDDDPSLKLVASDEPEVTFPVTNVLESYGTVNIPFTFRPQRPGPLLMKCVLSFDNPSCEPQEVIIKGNALRVPIYVEEQVIDYKTCLYDKLYRMPLVLRNRGSIALKCLTSIPAALRDAALEFHPPMGFVQARDKVTGEPGRFVIQMKFRPTPALMKRLGAHADAKTGRITVPLTVVAPDQVLPVLFTMTARLTASQLVFSPPSISFGPCFTTQAVAQPLTITNTSDLPLKFGFVRLPACISVAPSDGFGVLLPHETVSRDVIFSAPAATDEKFALTVRTTMNREFRIPCTAAGVVAPLRLSHSKLQFRAMSVGEQDAQSVYLTNMTAKPITFEAQVPFPHLAHLKVSPCVATIEPGQACRVEVLFVPAADPKKLKEAEEEEEAEAGEGGEEGEKEEEGKGEDAGEEEKKHEKQEEKEDLYAKMREEIAAIPRHMGSVQYSAAEDAKEEEDVEEVSTSSEPWSRHGSWRIPFFMRQSGDEETEAYTYSDALILEVGTTTVTRILEADRTRVEFGQLAVGQNSVTTVRIRNIGSRMAALRASGLNPIGSFTIVNALRTVPAGEYQDLAIQFKPPRHAKYCETVTIRSGSGSVQLLLLGEGVSPCLALSPESGLLDVGHVLQGDTATSKFSLTNTSVFPLRFTIQLKTQSYSNYSPLEVFSCSPSEAEIPPGETQDVEVTFSPDHMRKDQFVAVFAVNIPMQAEENELKVTVRGKSWDRQVYVIPENAADEMPSNDPTMLTNGLAAPVALAPTATSLLSQLSAIALGGTGADLPEDDSKDGELPATNYEYRLEFPKPATTDGTAEFKKTILVGGCSTAQPGAAAGSYEVVLDAENAAVAAGVFSCDAAKGNVAAGSSSKVVFTFRPPAVEDRAANGQRQGKGEEEHKSADAAQGDADAAGSGSGSGSGASSVGQWATATASIVLRGGCCPAGVPDGQVVKVALRGFVPL